MRFVLASVMLLSLSAKLESADLYRWVDPETGSVKFSSYPPPWHGDAAKERRAPKVEVIPAATSAPAPAPKPAANAEAVRFDNGRGAPTPANKEKPADER